MASDGAGLAALREALSELATREAPALVREATERARERALAQLTATLSEAMLDAVREQLGAAGPANRRREPARKPAAPAPNPAAAAAQSEPAGAGAADAPAGAHAAAAPAEAPAPPPAGGARTAVYVYGVTSADAHLGELPGGVDPGTPIRTIAEGDLAALVSDVGLADFDEERLREHLGDMRWVERTARRHEEVLEAAGASATVIPMRMCTVYASEDGVRELLREQGGPLHEALARLAGKTEWGVKVFARADAGRGAEDGGRDAEVEAEAPASAREVSGADYMRRRLRERDADARSKRELEEAAGMIHERLSAVAVEHAVAAPQRPEMSGRQAEMLLNGVYLVDDRAARDFQLLVQALSDDFAALGLELEETGPWPAYHFVPGAIGVGW